MLREGTVQADATLESTGVPTGAVGPGRTASSPPTVASGGSRALNRNWDTTIARAVAIVLIANSHLEAFYPRTWMAADGLLGNTLFFMISGLGLSARNRTNELGFSTWYLRRVRRIYPALWLCVLVLLVAVGGEWASWSPLDYVKALVWPTPYAFVRNIMIYYVVAYFALRYTSERTRWLPVAGSALIAMVYTAMTVAQLPSGRLSLGSIDTAFWDAWWLLAFFTGTALPHLQARAMRPGTVWWILGSTVAAYVALKYAMVVSGWIPQAFVLLNLAAGVAAIAIIRVGARADMCLRLISHPVVGPAFAWLSMLTLEVYMTHTFVLRRPEVATLAFPVNLVAFTVCALPLAAAVNAAAKWLTANVLPLARE